MGFLMLVGTSEVLYDAYIHRRTVLYMALEYPISQAMVLGWTFRQMLVPPQGKLFSRH